MSMPLTEILAELGYRTRTCLTPGVKLIVDGEDEAVFEGRAYQVWAWLRETEQLTKCCWRGRVVADDDETLMCAQCGRTA